MRFIVLLFAFQCGSFNTDRAHVTAHHCKPASFVLASVDHDISLATPKPGKTIPVGDGPPSYFVCRRGVRHRIKTFGQHRSGQWFVSLEFYPGESGMPVFNSSGQACGVVLGNVSTGDAWLGRVGILSEVFAIADGLGKLPDRARQK